MSAELLTQYERDREHTTKASVALWLSYSSFLISAASMDGRRIRKLGCRGHVGGGCLGGSAQKWSGGARRGVWGVIVQQRQVKGWKPPFQNLLDDHFFPFHCTLTRTPTPSTMPIVTFLQNLIYAHHNVP